VLNLECVKIKVGYYSSLSQLTRLTEFKMMLGFTWQVWYPDEVKQNSCIIYGIHAKRLTRAGRARALIITFDG
jgi:hypothetical protein